MSEETCKTQLLEELVRAVARDVPGSKIDQLCAGTIRFNRFGGELRLRPEGPLHIFAKAHIAGFPSEGGFSINCIPTWGQHREPDPDYSTTPLDTKAGTVYHSFKKISERAIMKFVNENCDLLSKLNLQGKEHLHFADGSYLFLHGQVADTSTLIERSKVVLELLDRNAKKEQPVRAFSTTMCGLNMGKKLGTGDLSTIRSRIGGPAPDTAKCCTCTDLAHLMASIDLNDAGFSKADLARLGIQRIEVYWCLKCMSDGPVFFAYSSDEFKLLKDASDLGPVGGPDDARPKDRDPAQLILSPRAKGSRPNRGSRVGGPPSWIQDPEVPECSSCGGGMEFLLQLFSDRNFSYGADMGTIYTFVCPKCRVGCYVIQCH